MDVQYNIYMYFMVIKINIQELYTVIIVLLIIMKQSIHIIYIYKSLKGEINTGDCTTCVYIG